MADIKMGIIGFGFMGHQHAKMIESVDEIDLVAICDNVESQMADAPEGVKKYSNMDDLIADEEVNTVLVVVPNPLHLETVEKCAKAGKDIICEKPAAMSVAEYDRMCEVTKECGVRFTIHHQRRWDNDYRVIKEVYDQGLVGQPYILKSQMYGVNGNMHDWHIYPEMGGGMLYDWGVHLIDQILYMVDSKILSVYADVQNVINEKVDDYFKVIIKYENGLTAELELGTYYLTPKRSWFLGGTTGSAIFELNFNPMEETKKIVRTKHLLENVPGKITMTAAGPTRSFGPPAPGLLYEEELPTVNVSHRDYFVNYVNAYYGKEELVVKLPEIRRVLMMLDAIRESARTHKAVDFE